MQKHGADTHVLVHGTAEMGLQLNLKTHVSDLSSAPVSFTMMKIMG